MAKFSYNLEILDPGRGWVRSAGSDVPRLYGEGYIAARRESPGPRLAMRLIRSDGRVEFEAPAVEDSSIGMVAGWPTASQYIRAAARAVDLATKARGAPGGTSPYYDYLAAVAFRLGAAAMILEDGGDL